MLAFGIHYLNGFVAASEPDDRDCVEWPPHPGRVFMALAAAHFQTGGAPEEREALLWLEQLEEPPTIAAPNAAQRAVVTHYVPVNDKAGPSKAILQSAPVTRDRQPRSFARAWLEEETAFMIWPGAEPSDAVRGALDSLCAKVSRIGHSSSLVQMWVAGIEDLPESNWVPDERRAVRRLRLAVRGTLADLERRYNGDAVGAFAALTVAAGDESDRRTQRAARQRLRAEFSDEPPLQLRPELSFYQGYAPAVRSDESRAAPGTVFSPDLLVFRLVPVKAPYRNLDLQSTLLLTEGWRRALLGVAGGLSDSARSMLSGLDASGAPLQDPHVALLPLAFVGHEQADGHLLGVALALPTVLPRAERHDVLLAVDKARRLNLGRMGTWRIERETSPRPSANLRPEVWTSYPSGATVWSSVTPLVYDRHPKARDKVAYQAETGQMISEACARIGLPAPREVTVTSVAAHLGVPAAHQFPRLRRKDNSERRHTHAILLFEQPVCGPITIGAGRYRGCGVFRPVPEAAISQEVG
jgi:CRISPR-associated protein Csb2